ncbi:MAG TPA: hypothetical protein VM030_08380 [Acidimicrobiales bacterium]|nr:hypothetical protein [Acidimicrobiales bacterium]
MRRAFRAAALAVVAVVVPLGITAAPAGAIETSQFGIDPVATPGQEADRISPEVRAGKETTGAVRVWNKTDKPVDLRMWAAPASFDRAGVVSLGGDGEASAWVEVPGAVHLGPKESRQVTVTVTGPRHVSPGTKPVALMAEVTSSGSAPAVLQRLAVVAYLRPAGPSSAALPRALVALAVLLLLAAVLLGRGRMAARWSQSRDQSRRALPLTASSIHV